MNASPHIDVRPIGNPVPIMEGHSEELLAAYQRIEELKVVLRTVRHELIEGDSINLVETCLGQIDEALDDGVVS